MDYLEMAQRLGYEECVDLEPYGSVDLVEVNALEQEQAHQWLYNNGHLPYEQLLYALADKKCIKMFGPMNYSIMDGSILFLSKPSEINDIFSEFIKNKVYRWKGSTTKFNGLIINPTKNNYNEITKFI